MPKTLLVINGPNLNLLGRREPDIYGNTSFEEYFGTLVERYSGTSLKYFQSNHEGHIIDKLQQVGFTYNGIVLNAGGYTHTSIAIADAVKGITTPVAEVHISNIYEREKYRHQSYIKPVSVISIVGKGLAGYAEAIDFLLKY